MLSDFEQGRDTPFSRAYVAFWNYCLPDCILRREASGLDSINEKQFQNILEENRFDNGIVKSLEGNLINLN